MKGLVVLLVLITVSLQTEGEAVGVIIRAYNATGMVNIVANDPNKKITFTLGARILLTCDVTGLPAGNVAANYTWYHNCVRSDCVISEGAPYYTVVNDTLLVDVVSMENVGKYHCHVTYEDVQGKLHRAEHFTTRIALADNPAAFLFTPTYLLLEYSIIIIQQMHMVGRDLDQLQWVKCTSRAGGEPLIHGKVPNQPRTSTNGETATLMLNRQHLPQNGFYYCLANAKRYNFAMFLRNQSTLATPTVGINTGEWTIASPDGSQVKKYIVALECSVRNITFVVKYLLLSANANGGSGHAAMSAPCFGGLGQLYRLKVWAVSGHNISHQPAVKCLTPDGQCKREDGSTTNPVTLAPTAVGSRGKTSEIAYLPSNAPSGPQVTVEMPELGTFIGVGVGVGALVFLVVLMAVAMAIVVVLVVRRKAAHKLNGNETKEDNLYYNQTVVAKQEREMKGTGIDADYDDVGNDKGAERGSIADGFNPYSDANSKEENNSAIMTPISKESPTPLKASNIEQLYAVVDKSTKKGAKEKWAEKLKKEDDFAISSKTGEYAMSMGKETDKGDRVDESGENSKAPGVEMLYAVVDKSRKKRK